MTLAQTNYFKKGAIELDAKASKKSIGFLQTINV